MTADNFDALLERAHAHASGYLHLQPDRHVGARASREELLTALQAPLTQQGESGAAVIDLLASQGGRGAVASGSPRYFGFVIGGTLAGRARCGLAGVDLGPERGHLRDFALVVSDRGRGGQMVARPVRPAAGIATSASSPAARWRASPASPPRGMRVLRRVGWDVEADGLNGAPRINVVTSAESHVTIDVGLALSRARHARAAARGHGRAGTHARRPAATHCWRRWTGRRSSARRPAT